MMKLTLQITILMMFLSSSHLMAKSQKLSKGLDLASQEKINVGYCLRDFLNKNAESKKGVDFFIEQMVDLYQGQSAQKILNQCEMELAKSPYSFSLGQTEEFSDFGTEEYIVFINNYIRDRVYDLTEEIKLIPQIQKNYLQFLFPLVSCRGGVLNGTFSFFTALGFHASFSICDSELGDYYYKMSFGPDIGFDVGLGDLTAGMTSSHFRMMKVHESNWYYTLSLSVGGGTILGAHARFDFNPSIVQMEDKYIYNELEKIKEKLSEDPTLETLDKIMGATSTESSIAFGIVSAVPLILAGETTHYLKKRDKMDRSKMYKELSFGND